MQQKQIQYIIIQFKVYILERGENPEPWKNIVIKIKMYFWTKKDKIDNEKRELRGRKLKKTLYMRIFI